MNDRNKNQKWPRKSAFSESSDDQDYNRNPGRNNRDKDSWRSQNKPNPDPQPAAEPRKKDFFRGEYDQSDSDSPKNNHFDRRRQAGRFNRRNHDRSETPEDSKNSPRRRFQTAREIDHDPSDRKNQTDHGRFSRDFRAEKRDFRSARRADSERTEKFSGNDFGGERVGNDEIQLLLKQANEKFSMAFGKLLERHEHELIKIKNYALKQGVRIRPSKNRENHENHENHENFISENFNSRSRNLDFDVNAPEYKRADSKIQRNANYNRQNANWADAGRPSWAVEGRRQPDARNSQGDRGRNGGQNFQRRGGRDLNARMTPNNKRGRDFGDRRGGERRPDGGRSANRKIPEDQNRSETRSERSEMSSGSDLGEDEIGWGQKGGEAAAKDKNISFDYEGDVEFCSDHGERGKKPKAKGKPKIDENRRKVEKEPRKDEIENKYRESSTGDGSGKSSGNDNANNTANDSLNAEETEADSGKKKTDALGRESEQKKDVKEEANEKANEKAKEEEVSFGISGSEESSEKDK